MSDSMRSVYDVTPPQGLTLYMDEYIQFLARTVTDPYADVMKLSTACIRMLAVSCQERFHMGSKPLCVIQSVLPAIVLRPSMFLRRLVLESICHPDRNDA